MIRSCNNCNNTIRFKIFYKQMLKDRYTYKCIECGTVHKATMFSIILNAIIYIVPFITLIGKRNLYLFSVAWIIFAHLIIQPLILQYREQKN